jgi:hypothetical protein
MGDVICLNLFMSHDEKAYRMLQKEHSCNCDGDFKLVNCILDNFRMKVSFATIYKMLKSQVLWDVMMCQG